ncbi:hypothetical protein A8924_1451 [Saccharopolyspora erythraea NRRL 2338]|uniref:Uncharacterized protein n=2 Tax=Saccharopolyspora erythraea TaxID=1836 RepID=A4F8L4_SACEN|nr:hypothetical protein [Saccharopolyspora erythraea]EQD85090.1 hypothetical protein N599_16485 [Saccharopolyspora erythraea D]PFG94184.1 hypothetical protein A8924_1451 [Saccharopolyspora erythraea NRRL 2338]QRK90964.1 hypothetical protein JQX30_05800 [Saccharopolyspora erythraea]CAM00389.1 hypothetical protein SACE_1057 [Saccharopolyspora erythraea NRRL 2338]
MRPPLPEQEAEELRAWRDHAARSGGRHARRSRPTRSGTAARGVSGALATGLLVLSLFLVGVQYWATSIGQQGPGVGVVVGHFVASALALVLQAVADRRRDLTGGLATAGAYVVALGALWFWWWV